MERVYTTLEMLEALDKDPILTFKRADGDCFDQWIVAKQNADRDNEVVFNSTITGLNKSISLTYDFLHATWQIANPSVLVQDAIKALYEEKTVTCRCGYCKYKQSIKQCVFPKGGDICVSAIQAGRWYIGEMPNE